jgi:multidrug efflux pump subunit AcrA (membrane-fusion protein)
VIEKLVRLPARYWLSVSAALLLLGGCAGHQAEVRGRPPSGPPVAVARLAAAPTNGTVTVRGTMAEK